jgi:Zn-finger nucleic acid-binding protein
MKCPACPTTSLTMTERSGIEIDYCPDCRGVWLDRGELDKIIERASPLPPPVSPAMADSRVMSYTRDDDDDDDDRRRFQPGYQSGYVSKKKKKGLLGDLFDF